MYAYAQARRHESEGLTFNAVSPGAAKTSLGSKAGGRFKMIEALTNPFVGPPEKGSRGCVRLMADPDPRHRRRRPLQLRKVEEVIQAVVTRTLRNGWPSRLNANCTHTTEALPHRLSPAGGAAMVAPSPTREPKPGQVSLVLVLDGPCWRSRCCVVGSALHRSIGGVLRVMLVEEVGVRLANLDQVAVRVVQVATKLCASVDGRGKKLRSLGRPVFVDFLNVGDTDVQEAAGFARGRGERHVRFVVGWGDRPR
jgi:hypothetical protein